MTYIYPCNWQQFVSNDNISEISWSFFSHVILVLFISSSSNRSCQLPPFLWLIIILRSVLLKLLTPDVDVYLTQTGKEGRNPTSWFLPKLHCENNRLKSSSINHHFSRFRAFLFGIT